MSTPALVTATAPTLNASDRWHGSPDGLLRRVFLHRSLAVAAGSLALGAPRRAAAAPAVELQGHRGARGLAPESTLAGFARALEIGVDTLELDTGITADDGVVVHHDRRLHPDHTRDSAGRWIPAPGRNLRELTLAEIRQLDVGRVRPGSRTATQFPSQQAVDGQGIPTLAEVLRMLEGPALASVRLNVETKLSPLAAEESASPELFVRLLLRVLRDAGALHRATVQSFDWRTLLEVQRQAPGTPTACLTSEQSWGPGVDDGVWTAGLRRAALGSVPRMVQAAGAQVWSPFFGDVTPESVREAHALGLRVAVWTVNDAGAIGRMLDLGVDALITDYPDRARQVMAERGLPLPPSRTAARAPGR